jgi:hypothetical protein
MKLYAVGTLVADIEAQTGVCQRAHLFDPQRCRDLYAELRSYRKVAEVLGCSYDTARRAVMGRSYR